ncbi:DUF6766 family protein [Stackebrandtia nassauensis]|uniref:Uncharacterized protein n=1 Tax=Stackebrandtia nassauensis (strain DSM 44728 / CIP 108903 / NRRL B-16338 / NBRC 102104 / LLR-40K-21) TaxID=446470 RepID=D3Q877_STANL|nr:DUF6766 family protein [Stackebrandtia nassauensis]ADD42451.1 hypothetical protein Snas_2775 [Stackebrandtia nassauensis DSM 44728]
MKGRTHEHLRRWGAVYVLVILFAGSWVGQFLAQLSEFTSEQRQHGVAFSWGDFASTFMASTFENWQSEWLQLVFQAILLLGAKHLIFRADSEDLERIEKKIDDVRAEMGLAEKPPSDPERASDKRKQQYGR